MRKLLIDSHALIWFFEGDARLPSAIKNLIEDADTAVHVSIVSFWEIAIKKSIGKLTLGNSISDLFQECENQDIAVLPISQQDIEAVELLPLHHRDPFDRIIIAAAKNNDLELVSVDNQFDAYPVKRIW